MSDWIKWGGGQSPVPPDTLVDIRMRDGSMICGTTACYWALDGGDGGIVEYRLTDARVPTPTSALSSQVSGDHYKKLKIQPIEYIHGNSIPFAEGCVIKYVSRWRDKGGIKDLEKAKHFIELLIELESKNAKPTI